MDNSKWYNQADQMNSQNNNNNDADNNSIDLTLTLGLPSPDFHPLYHDTQQGLANQGETIEGQQNFNGSQYAWASDQMSSSTVHNMINGNVFNQFSGPSIGRFPPYNTTDSYTNFAPTCPLPSPLPHPHELPLQGYTLLDVPPRRAAANQHHRELGSFSASASGSDSGRRQRFGNYNDPNKRCTNYNCNTNDTPMWRKGPLGPKTLCNACGIRYRKDEEKRKAKEARRRANSPTLMDK